MYCGGWRRRLEPSEFFLIEPGPTPTQPVIPERPVKLGVMGCFHPEYFPDAGPVPWLDRPGAEHAIRQAEGAAKITRAEAALCRHWRARGFVVLPKFYSPETLAPVWNAYDSAIAAGRLTPVIDYGKQSETDAYPGRVLNPHKSVPEIAGIWSDPKILAVLSLLLGVKALPFQTIGGHTGSEQFAHSDSIHMTTYPLSYLAATWIAFEDISPDAGPLEIYPGSHKLPYVFSKDAGFNRNNSDHLYGEYINKYEPAIARQIEMNGLKPEYFLAQTGDVLIWHANLLHGGSRRKNPALTRKALVCHYFAEGCVCYHDYTGTLSYLHPLKLRAEAFNPAAYLNVNPDVKAAGIDPWQHYINHGYDEGRNPGI
jgi:hypothetical protein